MKKERLLTIILAILLVVTVSYIAWKSAVKMRNSFIATGYSQAIYEIITEAEKEGCEPFSVFYGEKEVYLINTECLSGETEVGAGEEEDDNNPETEEN